MARATYSPSAMGRHLSVRHTSIHAQALADSLWLAPLIFKRYGASPTNYIYFRSCVRPSCRPMDNTALSRKATGRHLHITRNWPHVWVLSQLYFWREQPLHFRLARRFCANIRNGCRNTDIHGRSRLIFCRDLSDFRGLTSMRRTFLGSATYSSPV